MMAAYNAWLESWAQLLAARDIGCAATVADAVASSHLFEVIANGVQYRVGLRPRDRGRLGLQA